jgi:hypothetical protein
MARFALRMVKECSNAGLPALRAAVAAGLMAAVVLQTAAAGPNAILSNPASTRFRVIITASEQPLRRGESPLLVAAG